MKRLFLIKNPDLFQGEKNLTKNKDYKDGIHIDIKTEELNINGNTTNGLININNTVINFENDMGYIEKDWGISFPKSYIWCQGNSFSDSNASFMLSIADIPFKLFDFRGFICSLILDNKEYKFTTYNNAKLIKCNVTDNFVDITLKRGSYLLNIHSSYNIGHKLSAPVKGKMEKVIFESISSCVSVTLQKNNSVVFSDTSKNCGLEVVQ